MFTGGRRKRVGEERERKGSVIERRSKVFHDFFSTIVCPLLRGRRSILSFSLVRRLADWNKRNYVTCIRGLTIVRSLVFTFLSLTLARSLASSFSWQLILYLVTIVYANSTLAERSVSLSLSRFLSLTRDTRVPPFAVGIFRGRVAREPCREKTT